MSLPVQALDRLFARLAATYGAAWERSLGSTPLADVKTAWSHELSGFAGSLNRIAWALENLPPKCPNVIEFKALCRQAPAPDGLCRPDPPPRTPDPLPGPGLAGTAQGHRPSHPEAGPGGPPGVF